MALSINRSGADLLKSLRALRFQPQNEASQKHLVELLLSTVHFQVMKKQMLEPSSPDVQSRSGSSYMGVCASPARARAHGHPECSFWYGTEDKSINFLAVMRHSGALSRNATASEMIALTAGLHVKQRRLSKEDRIACTLATDGDVFRFFRTDKEGQLCETQCRCGNGYEDAILLLVVVFNHALVPPGARTALSAAQEDLTEEYHKGQQIMLNMTVQVGVNVYMNVLQELPVRLGRVAERNTLNLIRQVIFEAIRSQFEAIQNGDFEKEFTSYGAAFMRIFDAGLQKVLEKVDFKDYNDNQKVLKHAIRKAVLKEIRPVFDGILTEVRDTKLKNFFK
ncbi:hypothetical protein PITC_093360 [Penicillium italicum]|uniref:Uncharacterized protein n=1 Tax=Penicillium italicum TaxID=40296 RepID=A0A0A2K9V4_PENIT|nr:hypothetical protein PITC_093360 [Penicillium italicum]